MARMLSRSKSLRMLRGGHKDIHQQDSGHSTPLPAHSQVDLDRLKAATPVTRTEGRVHTPDVVERPKTSSGSGERGKLFHKKVTPATLSPADSTSRVPSPSPSKSTTTILYTAEVHEDTEGVIGIALGSPTMNPPWITTPQGATLGTVTHISSSPPPLRTPEVRHEPPKPKLSRWKSLFGRKPVTHEQKQSFYQLAQSVAPVRADSHHDDESLASRAASRAEDFRPEPWSASPPVFKLDIRESRWFPKGQEQPNTERRPRALTTIPNPLGKAKTPLMRSASSPRPQLRDDWGHQASVPQVIVSETSQSPSSTMNSVGPLLDVDIPSIKLDRYSVMFGSLLQSNTTSASASNRTSALLVRRQGNSEKLKPLNELSVKKEEDGPRRNSKPHRRATSPSHPKSPSVVLSLFPQSTSNRAPASPRTLSAYRPRPLRRSKTAPASSPNRQNFLLKDPYDDHTKEVSQDEQSRDQIPETEEDPNLKSQLLSATPSSRHSFDSESDVSIIMGASPLAPWKPRKGEPEWELVTKPSQTAALRSHPPSGPAVEHGPSSAPLESISTSLKPKAQNVDATPRSAGQAPAPTLHVQSPSGTQTATISIARSVSVSRASPRSADVVKPTLVRRATERALSPASGRFIDQKPLTPTLVELGNRKSQRVQLVEA